MLLNLSWPAVSLRSSSTCWHKYFFSSFTKHHTFLQEESPFVKWVSFHSYPAHVPVLHCAHPKQVYKITGWDIKHKKRLCARKTAMLPFPLHTFLTIVLKCQLVIQGRKHLLFPHQKKYLRQRQNPLFGSRQDIMLTKLHAVIVRDL